MKRLVTRSDFDGLVCAMLLKEMNIIDEIKFVHPKDVQDGKVDITENDITTTSVYRLTEAERQEEIARMLAGEVISDEARAAALKLMK